MSKSQANVIDAPFQGRWRISEMELWDNDALNLVEPAFINIAGQEGEMRFITVQAWLDLRYTAHGGITRAEFSWEGVEEGDQRSGRGWLETETAYRLIGHIYFHMGDDSALVCEPW